MEKKEADFVIHNAVIYTVDESFNIYEAMAVRGDSILEVGAENQILNKYSTSTLIDLGKKVIYPGFIDAHSHFKGYAESLGKVNLLGVSSPLDICKRVSEFSEKGKWITGRGWDNTTWEDQDFPDKSCLDEQFPDHFIVLKRIDGHAALVNQNVLDLAGIDENTVVEGGKIMTKNGVCTGILIDNAADLLEEFIPEMNIEQKKSLITKAEGHCFSVGLTSVCDAGLDKADIDLIKEMRSSGDLSIKLYIMLNPTKENYDHYLELGPQQSRDLSITSFKFYADGALGSRGAALIEPYSDADENERTYNGLFLSDIDSLRHYAEKMYDAGFQVNTHAIGDMANRIILELYGEILGGVNDKRWRIEHAQVVSPDDIHLFADYSIIPSVQPTHCTSDMDWAKDRLGDERISHAYAYKTLKAQNGMIAFGTDFPVENINPLYTLLSAMKRTDISGSPDGGYKMDEAIDFESSLRAMTIWAALANFEENSKGSIEKGKKADFVIFNRDLKFLDAKNMEGYQLEQTFLNGRQVYRFED